MMRTCIIQCIYNIVYIHMYQYVYSYIHVIVNLLLLRGTAKPIVTLNDTLLCFDSFAIGRNKELFNKVYVLDQLGQSLCVLALVHSRDRVQSFVDRLSKLCVQFLVIEFLLVTPTTLHDVG